MIFFSILFLLSSFLRLSINQIPRYDRHLYINRNTFRGNNDIFKNWIFILKYYF